MILRRYSLALISSAAWGGCLAVASAAFALGGTANGFLFGLCGGVAALMISLLAGRSADRAETRKLRALGHAVGLDQHEVVGVETVARSLFGRLDRGRAFKAAVQNLSRLVLIADLRGEILALSRGFDALSVDAAEGGPLASLFGQVPDGGESEPTAPDTVILSGRRYRVQRQGLPGGQVLVEFDLVGHHIGEDDLDAFVTALANGRTSFRFDDWGGEHSPVLKSLGQALDTMDRGLRALDQMFQGQAVDPALVSGQGAFIAQVRMFKDQYEQMLAERDMALEARAGLQGKLSSILEAIDRYRGSVTALADLADRSRAGLSAASLSMGKSRDRTFGLQQLEKEALALAADAALAAERNLRAVTGLTDSARAIEQALGTLEVSSHRTSVVALNAAVEAARAGEKAATFALLATEVRTLSQVSQRAVREIRMMVNASRASIGASSGESGVLQKTIKDLGIRLHNISIDTDMISGTLAEGSGTMARLDSHFGAVGAEAAKAILFPRPRDSAA